MLAILIDLTRESNYLLRAFNSKRPPPLPKPFPRPVLARERVERTRARQRHERLVARVLGR